MYALVPHRISLATPPVRTMRVLLPNRRSISRNTVLVGYASRRRAAKSVRKKKTQHRRICIEISMKINK